MTQRDRNKRYGTYALGIVVGLSGVAIAFIELNDLLIRSLGILMCLGGAYLIRVSKIQGRVGLRGARNKSSRGVGTNRPRRPAWILGAASLVACGISFWFMNKDALDGYHNPWPLYAFIVSGTIFMLVSSYIAGVLIWKMFNH